MRRKSCFLIVFSGVLLVACVIFAHCRKDNTIDEMPEQIGNLEQATAIVKEYYADGKDYSALDYHENDDDKSLINYAIVFYDRAELDQANLLINTKIGTGSLNFSGDMYTFEYSADDGITIVDTDTITLSFTEYHEKAIYDFQVTCIQLSDTDIHFKVASEVR